MNAFRRALAKSDRVLDVKMGEAVSIVPMRSGDFGDRVDPDRVTHDTVALVNWVDPSSADISRLESRVAYEETEIAIRRSLLPDGFKPRKGDYVILLDQPGSPRHKVNRVDANDPERLLITLAPIAASEA